jgi:ABC-type multidrug transport system ATPase subunit
MSSIAQPELSFNQSTVNQSLIDMVGLNKTLGTSKIINGFDLSIKSGEVMCLLGTNGSGKTTLVNLVTGLIPLDSDDGGDVTINIADEDRRVSLRASLTEFRSYVRLCQQDDFLFDELTASEHLELVCRLRGIQGKESIAEVIAEKAREVDVETEINKKVKFISPGAKRKLSIAMALIGDAKFIILDEPTSNLDLKSREKIWLLIKKIA